VRRAALEVYLMTEPDKTQPEYYMREALLEARAAVSHGDVPVGAVVVSENGEIIARAHNRCVAEHDATAHAELLAIRAACAAVGSERLDGGAIYVTCEPCPMCAGAILQARLGAVFYGTAEPNTGACGSVVDLFFEYGKRVRVRGGILRAECGGIMGEFFEGVRK
jgi:tRNA(adenine34) deaminase